MVVYSSSSPSSSCSPPSSQMSADKVLMDFALCKERCLSMDDDDDDASEDASMRSGEDDDDDDNSCSSSINDDDGDDDGSCSSHDSDSSYWDDEDEDIDDDDDMAMAEDEALLLLRTLPRLASSPAFFNRMTKAAVNGGAGPLIPKATVDRDNLMRADSSRNFVVQPMFAAQAPSSLVERMRASELVIGTTNNHTTTIASPSAPVVVSPVAAAVAAPIVAATTTMKTTNSGSPQAHYLHLLQQQQAAAAAAAAAPGGGKKIQPIRASDVKQCLTNKKFFLDITPEHIAGYDMAKTVALRTEDITAFRQMIHGAAPGAPRQSLQVCNRFGESLIHAVCRRGSLPLLQFLLDEAHVSLQVVDDYGRTPMHDACWTVEPNFGVVSRILTTCPDLLLITDQRGCSPLDYVRKEHWSTWCEFLTLHQDKLMPRQLLLE